MNQLLYSLNVSNTEDLMIISGIVDELEKLCGHGQLNLMNETQVGHSNNTSDLFQLLNQWIIDLTSIASELPQQLQKRVKLLFHRVFDSILTDSVV